MAKIIGRITKISEVCFGWKINDFRSLNEGDRNWYSSPEFPFAGGMWKLGLNKIVDFYVILTLSRRGPSGPLTIDVEYTLSMKDSDGSAYGAQTNRREFKLWKYTPWIPFRMERSSMSKLLQNNTLTVLCDLKCFDGTHDAAELKERLQQKTAKLAEKQSELVRLQHLNEELNLKVIDLENSRDNVQKSLESNNTAVGHVRLRPNSIMGDEIGRITKISEGCLEWKIGFFRSLNEGGRNWYTSPEFPFAGGVWILGLNKIVDFCFILTLSRRGPDGSSTVDVEYTVSMKCSDGLAHREQEIRREVKIGTETLWIPFQMADGRWFKFRLLPLDTLTVLCDLKCFDRTQDAEELEERLQQKTAELAEQKSELVRLQRLNEELNLKVIDLENSRDNAQKSLKINTELRESLEKRIAELQSELVRLEFQNHELNRKNLAVESKRDNVQKLLETEKEQKTAELAEKQSELARLQRLNEELYIKVIGLETNRDNVQKLLEAESLFCKEKRFNQILKTALVLLLQGFSKEESLMLSLLISGNFQL